MHPRYFIGITIPEDLSSKIEKVQQNLLPGHKVMAPLLPHITLLHPNILMTVSPLYLVPKLNEITADYLPLDIELIKTALFDKRVLHIAVKSPELIKLQSALVQLLPDDIRARYQIGRAFTPHVTLAQAKPLQQLSDELIDGFEHALDPLLPKKFKAEKLSQFTWVKPREYKIETI